MSRPRNEFDDGPTDPHGTLDPDQRLALHGERTGDDLIAEVLADPDNDQLRLVYGDYLLERDDPRGEFIQLQLELHRTRQHDDVRWHRMRELAANRIPAWCDPLFPALVPESIEFWRGFLWKCRTQDSTIALRDVIGHAMWATVGDLESHDLTLVAHRCMRSLVTLRTGQAGLAALASATHESRVTKVQLLNGIAEFRMNNSHDWRGDANWGRILAIGALRNLRSFATWESMHPLGTATRGLLASPLGQQLVELEFWMMSGSMEHWTEILLEHPTLRRIAIHTGFALDWRHHPDDRGAVVLERDDHGAAHLIVEGEVRNDHAVATAASLAQRYPSVYVRPRSAVLEEPPMVAALRAHFANVVLI